MRYHLELFLLALSFYTRIPVPAWLPWSSERMLACGRYLPLVGWVVALACTAVFWVCSGFFSPFLSVLSAMAAGICVTGCFHEDGWADSCDSLGGWTREQKLTIMKDSRLGTYGVTGLFFMLALKAAVLIELAGSEDGRMMTMIALCVAHPLSRLSPLLLIQTLPYVSDEKTAKSVVMVNQRQGAAAMLIAVICACLPLLLLPAVCMAGCVLLAWALATLLAFRHFKHKLGGYTGDNLGATQQLAELAIYFGIMMTWNFT